MSDAVRRKGTRDRKAAEMAGVVVSPEADAAEAQRAWRYSANPYSHLVGQWVLVEGVVHHYRGRLLDAIPVGGGKHKLFFSPLYNMANFDDSSPGLSEGEHALNTREDCPAVLNDEIVQEISLQPKAWPKA